MEETRIFSANTEQVSDKYKHLDSMGAQEICALMNEADETVTAAIRPHLPTIAEVSERIAGALRDGNRLFYVGCGTAGRLGILDAAECPPTFNSPPDQVVGIIGGGKKAIQEAVEGAEDSRELGEQAISDHRVKKGDVVIGIAASGRTPFTVAAIEKAKELGAFSVGLSCSENSELAKVADIGIEVITGPEVIAGSTRLKAGSAQKMVLNMLSTTAMVLNGKTYQNRMVDVRATNEKLRLRARRMVEDLADVSPEEAQNALAASDGNVKVALAHLLLEIPADMAQELLHKHQGHLRSLLSERK